MPEEHGHMGESPVVQRLLRNLGYLSYGERLRAFSSWGIFPHMQMFDGKD